MSAQFAEHLMRAYNPARRCVPVQQLLQCYRLQAPTFGGTRQQLPIYVRFVIVSALRAYRRSLALTLICAATKLSPRTVADYLAECAAEMRAGAALCDSAYAVPLTSVHCRNRDVAPLRSNRLYYSVAREYVDWCVRSGQVDPRMLYTDLMLNAGLVELWE